MPCALVVEDDLPTIALVTALLRRLGFATRTAGNVPDALTLLEHQPAVDLVILDIFLPGLPRTQVLEVVRRSFPQTKVLIASAHLAMDQGTLAATAGIPRLIKPFSRQQFDAAIVGMGLVTV